MKHQVDLQRVVAFYESLIYASLGEIDSIYAPDAYFKDPFNEVHDIDAIRRIFEHMFQQLDAPRFVVTTQVLQGTHAFLTWDFLFRMKRFSERELCIRGATHVRFAENGLVELHRDYWDAAEELYEKIPVLGSVMRVLKRRARAA